MKLREQLGLEDMVAVFQRNRLQWYGHVLWQDDNEWVKKCLDYGI